MDANPSQLNIAMVRSEFLILDRLVVERLAQDQKVVRREIGSELRSANRQSGNQVVFVQRTPFDIGNGSIVVRWVGRGDVETRLEVPWQAELALRLELRLVKDRRVTADFGIKVLQLKSCLSEGHEVGGRNLIESRRCRPCYSRHE